MREYKLLFCFANNIEAVISSLKNYSQDKDYTFQIEHITDYSSLISYERLNMFDCIIIQEFFSAENPITVDYLCNFLVFENLKVICIFDESKRKYYSEQLYKKGLYNCFFGEDAINLSIEKFANIIIKGRSFIEARNYYNINFHDEENININKTTISKVIELAKLYEDDEELLADEFNNMAENFNDFEIRMLIAQLPSKTIEKLLCIPRFYLQYQRVKENLLDYDKQKKFISLDKNSIDEIKLIPVNSKNIGVVNLSQGAGATFFTMNFSKAMSEFMKVSVIELPTMQPYMYYYLGLNALCGENLIDFTSYAHIINENKSPQGNYYVHAKNSNIYWIITDATRYQIDNWDATKMMRLLYMPKSSSLNIVDLGDKLFEPYIINIIEQFYMILVVIDPMIPNVLNSFEYFEKIKSLQEEKGIHIEYIVNKYSNGIDNNDLLSFLNVKPIAYIPYINSKYIYKAVYEAELPCNISDVKNELYPAFNKLLKIIVPKEIYEQKTYKNKKLINKLKNM